MFCTDATDFIKALSRRRSGSFDKLAFCARVCTCLQFLHLCKAERGGGRGRGVILSLLTSHQEGNIMQMSWMWELIGVD